MLAPTVAACSPRGEQIRRGACATLAAPKPWRTPVLRRTCCKHLHPLTRLLASTRSGGALAQAIFCCRQVIGLLGYTYRAIVLRRRDLGNNTSSCRHTTAHLAALLYCVLASKSTTEQTASRSPRSTREANTTRLFIETSICKRSGKPVGLRQRLRNPVANRPPIRM